MLGVFCQILPCNATAEKTIVEALWCYLAMVGMIIIISLVTGSVFIALFSLDIGTIVMRLINGCLATVAAYRTIKAKNLPNYHYGALIVCAITGSAGYEIIALAYVAYLTTVPIRQANA